MNELRDLVHAIDREAMASTTGGFVRLDRIHDQLVAARAIVPGPVPEPGPVKPAASIPERANCGGCAFAVDHDSTAGDNPRTPSLHCHRYPPTPILPTDTSIYPVPFHPPVSRGEWCGEYRSANP